jgi:hypothetical protein
MLQPCPKCQNQNRPDAKFCAYCRTPLTASEPQPAAAPPAPPAGGVACPQCGKVVNPRAKFCNYCGQVLVQPSMAALAPPSASANASASPPPPYTPPAYTPSKQGLSRRQSVIVVASGVAVIAILIILIIVAVSPPSAQPATSGLPTPTTTPALTLTPQETRQPLTATPKSVKASPPADGAPGQACVLPRPDNARRYIVEQGVNLSEIARHCRMGDMEFQIFLLWNQLDQKEPQIHPRDCLWVPASCTEYLP